MHTFSIDVPLLAYSHLLLIIRAHDGVELHCVKSIHVKRSQGESLAVVTSLFRIG